MPPLFSGRFDHPSEGLKYVHAHIWLMIDRNLGQKPDEVELQRMRTLAEAGNPMYMYEYGRAVIAQDPDTGIRFLEDALSRGIGDAGLVLRDHCQKSGDMRGACSYMLESARYDRSLLLKASKLVFNHGDDVLLERYVSLCGSSSEVTDRDRAEGTFVKALVFDAVSRNPDRFPEHAKDNEALMKEVYDSVNAMLDDGFWRDPELYKILDVTSELSDKNVRRKLRTRMRYLRDNDGTEPDNLDVMVEMSECLMYATKNVEYQERLEELASQGLIATDGPEMADCGRRRLGWVYALKGEKPPMPVIDVGEDWDSEENLTRVGRMYLGIGRYHVVARMMLHQAALRGSAEAMFLLGYMVRMRLGEYDYYETVSTLEDSYRLYTELRPGDEMSGIEWMEKAATNGCEEAKKYIQSLADAGDLEAGFALERIRREKAARLRSPIYPLERWCDLSDYERVQTVIRQWLKEYGFGRHGIPGIFSRFYGMDCAGTGISHGGMA